MSPPIPAGLLRKVRRRAANRCEYCRLPQESQEAAFHADHIRPRKEGGPTTADNLALACVTCSLKKAARTHAVDPRTNVVVPLFHPRHDRWDDHFRWTARWRVIGKTPTGRATVRTLAMNRPRILRIRRALDILGTFP
jgi:5-methylcytosine-specific restriction endonuclease McrA